ncbi:hypothetical protein [Paludisphaera borealis]|uniref:Lipoprotein n=1 Tax=Paludisphaera borealis TaxID=1387353 RepID=A0A1U7CZ25_9BACT|nr:hypothetical protein [Paludisphaera borealis]APW64148.1 hypothetical protein BSF38_05740 [Paludisphaera borealis]
MARNAILWLSCLFLLGATGCTWTETYNEYPPSARADDEGGQHHHHHQQDQAPPAE